MYCPNCSQEVGESTRVCPACGELLNAENQNFNPQPYQANINNVSIPPLPDYKVQSILLIVFSVICCFTCFSLAGLPFAIVALVTGNKVRVHQQAGNDDLALEASKKAKMWCWISFGIVLISILIFVFRLIFNYDAIVEMYEEIMRQMEMNQF